MPQGVPPAEVSTNVVDRNKLLEAFKALAPFISKIGGRFAGQGPAPGVQSEARVGQQVGPIRYDPRTTGQLPTPVPTPTREGYSSSPYGPQMMQKLDPSGGAVYNAIQGVSKLLQDWQQRRDQRQHVEAANIAQNLMAAMDHGDEATKQAILNDPKAIKILNKILPGWLTKAKESQKKPDIDIGGFEAGIQQYVQGKSQQQTQEPRQVGGYLLPQAGPAEQLRGAQISAETQAAQQDPARLLSTQLGSQQIGQAERIAAQLEVSPKEVAILDASAQRTAVKGYFDLLRAAAIQDVISARAEKIQGLITERSRMVENLRGGYRVKAAGIIRDAHKSGKSEDVEFKILKEQIDSAGKLRTNANSMYEKLLGKDDQAAQAMKAQVDELDSKIRVWNDQLDSLKNRRVLNDVLMYLLTPEEREGIEEEKEPPAEE